MSHCSKYFRANAQMPTNERAVVKESANGTFESVKVMRNQYSVPHATKVMAVQSKASRLGKWVMAS